MLISAKIILYGGFLYELFFVFWINVQFFIINFVNKLKINLVEVYDYLLNSLNRWRDMLIKNINFDKIFLEIKVIY